MLSNKGFAEFSNPDQKREFMEAAQSKQMLSFDFRGNTVQVRHAVSKVNKHRTYKLFEAERMIKECEAAKGKSVELKINDRDIKVDNEVAFRQSKGELAGSFLGPFAHLTWA